MALTKTIIAKKRTFLKKDWRKQSSQLPSGQKKEVKAGESYAFVEVEESSLNGKDNNLAGHSLVKLAYGQGDWYVFVENWEFPWDCANLYEGDLPEWNEIDWHNFDQAVSKYFTVAEVVHMSRERIPQRNQIKKNIVAIARDLDLVREWWGSPLLINSWFRPMAVEIRIGGSKANHPYGFAVDLRPAQGSVHELQRRFKAEWYDKGRWPGGFGLGAHRGFIHLDKRKPTTPRCWNY